MTDFLSIAKQVVEIGVAPALLLFICIYSVKLGYWLGAEVIKPLVSQCLAYASSVIRTQEENAETLRELVDLLKSGSVVVARRRAGREHRPGEVE